jgi:hypothetical protein
LNRQAAAERHRDQLQEFSGFLALASSAPWRFSLFLDENYL